MGAAAVSTFDKGEAVHFQGSGGDWFDDRMRAANPSPSIYALLCSLQDIRDASAIGMRAK
jgi:hypothetical protein